MLSEMLSSTSFWDSEKGSENRSINRISPVSIFELLIRGPLGAALEVVIKYGMDELRKFSKTRAMSW